MARGADPLKIRRLLTARGSRLVVIVIGIGLGLVLSLPVNRLLSKVLVGIGTVDLFAVLGASLDRTASIGAAADGCSGGCL